MHAHEIPLDARAKGRRIISTESDLPFITSVKKGCVVTLKRDDLRILAEIIERGIAQGVFAPCDAWEVAGILWTLANAIIRTERSSVQRSLRRRALDTFFDDAIALVLRGLTRPAVCEPDMTNAPRL